MNGQDFPAIAIPVALALSAACLLVVAFTRSGTNRRRTRFIMGCAAALGGIALLLLG